MTLESLIRCDVISSKKTLLAYTFPNNGVHEQLRNHRCHSQLDSDRGLFQGFHLLHSGKAFHVSELGWCTWWFLGFKDQGCE